MFIEINISPIEIDPAHHRGRLRRSHIICRIFWLRTCGSFLLLRSAYEASALDWGRASLKSLGEQAGVSPSAYARYV
jgi:hypothetical protein